MLHYISTPHHVLLLELCYINKILSFIRISLYLQEFPYDMLLNYIPKITLYYLYSLTLQHCNFHTFMAFSYITGSSLCYVN